MRTIRALAMLLLFPAVALAADHADSPLLTSIGRHDARITDLHAWARGDDLVLSLCTNPTAARVATYRFPEDLTLRFHIDNDSEVSYDDAELNAIYGGDIVEPGKISAEIVLEVTFDASGEPWLAADGLADDAPVQLFAGLRDDPFIRGPRQGANTPCIVAELPLAAVLEEQSTLLVWATSKVPDVRGPMAEMAGRALYSMFPENDAMNTATPRNHYRVYGLRPDVMIYDTSRPAGYPNGRLLTDDVVDLVGDARVLGNDAPFPTANDTPFLDVFPYLAEPWPF